jgi:hypothetical protein
MSMPDTIRVSPNDLTWREAKLVRSVTGTSIGQMFSGDGSDPDEEHLAALCWIVLRRTRPDVTLDDVLDMPVGSFAFADPDEIAGADDAADGDVADPEGESGETPHSSSSPKTSNSSLS